LFTQIGIGHELKIDKGQTIGRMIGIMHGNMAMEGLGTII
jgi:hypothetical protein